MRKFPLKEIFNIPRHFLPLIRHFSRSLMSSMNFFFFANKLKSNVFSGPKERAQIFTAIASAYFTVGAAYVNRRSTNRLPNTHCHVLFNEHCLCQERILLNTHTRSFAHRPSPHTHTHSHTHMGKHNDNG